MHLGFNVDIGTSFKQHTYDLEMTFQRRKHEACPPILQRRGGKDGILEMVKDCVGSGTCLLRSFAIVLVWMLGVKGGLVRDVC